MSISIERALDVATGTFGLAAQSAIQLVGEWDLNFLILGDSGRNCILKVSHPDARRAQLEMENQAMLHLRMHDFELRTYP